MKRFSAFLCAFVILIASVPAFALGPNPTVPGYIMERRKLDACSSDTNKWLAGYIETAPAIVTDAVNRLSNDSPGVVPDLALITAVSGGYTDVKLLYAPAATSYTHANLGVNPSNSTWPYLRGYGNSITEANYYKYSTYQYTGTFDDPVFYRRKDFDGNQASTFFMSGTVYIRYSAPWAVNYTATVPDETCIGQVSISPGYIAFDAPTTPPGPSFDGTVNFSLNPGNVLVFEKAGGFSGLDPLPVSGTSLPKSLGWLEKTWSTGVTYGPSLAFPSTSTNLTENYLYWNKVPGTQNLWGITTSGTGSIPIQGPNDFYWIVNPIGVYRNSKWVNNPPITITFNPSDFDAVYLTPMINMDGMAYIPESFDPVYKKYKIDFDVDSGDTSYTDTATDTSVPSADANRPGGLNGYDDVEDGAIGETVGGILGILQSGARAIESLVNGARSFFEALNGMYDWLPDDVQTILNASLFLVFAIGVIKVLH